MLGWVATLLIFAAALVVRWPLLDEAPQDDALITLRYAENIVAGEGFVYNPGQPVLGTSTPLYTLLLAFLGWCGLPMLAAGRWINVIADASTAALVVRMLPKRSGLTVVLAAGLLYVFNGLNVMWAASGMETGLYVLLVTSAVHLLSCGSFVSAMLVASLATLTRPDGILALAIVALGAMLHSRRIPWKEALVAAAVLTPWLLFSSLYFGSPLPHSAWVKFSFYRQHFVLPPVRVLVAQYFGTPTLFLGGFVWAKALHFVLAMGGLLWIALADRRLWALPGYLILYSAALLASGSLLFPWYLAPLTAPYSVLAALGCLVAQEIVTRRLAQPRLRQAAVAAAALCLLALLIPAVGSSVVAYTEARKNSRGIESSTKALGLWLRQNSSPTAVVCAGDIGHIGYYSKRRILDYVGLVSPEVSPFNRSDRRADIVREFEPDYVAVATYDPLYAQLTEESPWFQEAYFLVTTEFENGSGVVYPLWRRRD